MHTLYLNTPCQPSYKFQTNCGNVAHSLCLKYGSYITLCPCSVQNTITIIKENVRPNDKLIPSQKGSHVPSYRITYNNTSVTTSSPLHDISNLLYAHRGYDSSVFALHGAAIATNNNAILFLAATTGGKTTLTSFLTSKGFGYITDDCILLDRETFEIIPYTTPLHLRRGGIAVLQEYGIRPDKLAHLGDPSFERYTYTPDNCITVPLPLDQIFFLTRTSCENRMEEMNSIDRMTALLKSPIVDYPMDSKYLHFIARLARVPCHRLLYSDMNYVLEQLHSFTFEN